MSILFDGNDGAAVRALMKEHGDSQFPFIGENEDGERVEIHITATSVVCKTYQHNGWIRVNHYDESGLPEGEIFDGKWT